MPIHHLGSKNTSFRVKKHHFRVKTPVLGSKCTHFRVKMHPSQGENAPISGSKCTHFREKMHQFHGETGSKCTNFMEKNRVKMHQFLVQMHPISGPNAKTPNVVFLLKTAKMWFFTQNRQNVVLLKNPQKTIQPGEHFSTKDNPAW